MENKRTVLIERYSKEENQTIGRLYIMSEDGFSLWNCSVLELPWKDNQRNISCIPAGEYECIFHISPKFGECFWVRNVPGRSEILIHVGNFNRNTLGCILPGLYLSDLDNDGDIDVADSRAAMDVMLDMLPNKFKLIIEE